MDAELAPFLSGEALIFDMRIDKPKVRLRLLKDGTLDWMRGSQRGNSGQDRRARKCRRSAAARSSSSTSNPGRTRRITDLNAEMSAKSLAGPWQIEGDAALDGEHGKLRHFQQPAGRERRAAACARGWCRTSIPSASISMAS